MNEDYKAGLLAEIEANQEDGEEALLSAQQEADFKKAVENCNAKFDEVSEIRIISWKDTYKMKC